MKLQNFFFGLWKNTELEIRSHKIIYIILFFVLLGGLFFRTYRTEDLLRFYYDQGRDALVIWKLWHEGKPFLIGPVTGLHGIFLGPFYYYFIAPFYLLGGGSPVYPAVFLSFLSMVAIIVIYYLGWKMQSRATGIIAAIIASFSYYIVLAGRWLANPTPLLLSSVLLLWVMWETNKNQESRNNNQFDIQIVKNQKDFLWILAALLIGISLQLEAASAVFYIPFVLVFWVFLYFTNKTALPSLKGLVIALLFFLLTLLPQIVFNFRHDNLLYKGFMRVLIEERSFQSPFTEFNLNKKRDFLWDVFSSKIFPGNVKYENLYYWVGFVGLIFAFFKKPRSVSLFLIYLIIPIIGYYFFQGNYGNIYDYYLTGYYLPVILLFSVGLGFVWKSLLGKIFVIFFFVAFFNLNLTLDKNLVRAGVDGETHITLGNQLQSVNWVFEDATTLKEYNVDVYVPPVIPHTYDYLLLWQGTKRCGENLCNLVKDKNVGVVYIIYEVDPPHPERLDSWLSKYKNTTYVEKEVKFGGITVQKRTRN